jgi:hypothetical protein
MKDEIHKQLFLIVKDLFRVNPWNIAENEDLFGICLKDSGQLYFVSIMGSAGIEYGALLMQGWKGYHSLANVATNDIDHDTMPNVSHFLSVSLCHRDELRRGFAAYNKKYDDNYSTEKPFYWIAAKEPEKVFHPPKDNEAEILYLCLKAIVELTQKSMLQPKDFIRGDEIKIFDVIKENEVLQITSRYECIKTSETANLTFKADENALNQLKSLPQLPAIYNLSAPSGMISIRQTVPRIVIIHDDVKDVILVMEIAPEKRVEEDAFRILKETFLGKNFLKTKGLPREIRTDSRLLYDSFKQILVPLGVRMVCVESIPKIKEIIKKFHSFPPKIINKRIPRH